MVVVSHHHGGFDAQRGVAESCSFRTASDYPDMLGFHRSLAGRDGADTVAPNAGPALTVQPPLTTTRLVDVLDMNIHSLDNAEYRGS